MNYKTISLFISNKKGQKLACEIYKPDTEIKIPAVLILHGFTGYKEENNLIDIAQRLAQTGIVTVRFTASGFGDSQGTIEQDYRLSTYRDDAECVYEYIQKLSYVDPKRIGICGHSMGGKLAVLFCADHPEIRALCAISAPVQFLSTAYGEKREAWEKLGYFEKISGRDEKSIRVPYAYVTDADSVAHDVFKVLGRITRPHALIIAGKSDETVPWKNTEEIFEGLACPKEFLLLDTVDHWYKKNPALLSVVHQPIEAFFKKYLCAE